VPQLEAAPSLGQKLVPTLGKDLKPLNQSEPPFTDVHFAACEALTHCPPDSANPLLQTQVSPDINELDGHE
jgi:hypothetical protein